MLPPCKSRAHGFIPVVSISAFQQVNILKLLKTRGAHVAGEREPKKRRKSSDGDKEARRKKQPREKKTGRSKANGEGEEELFDFLEKEDGSEVSPQNA